MSKAICRKRFVMMTKEETMKVIAEEVRPEEYCPIVDEVARQASYAFELAAESSFENDEDEIIFDLVMRLLGGGQYMLIGNLIETQFISVGDWNFGSAISLILAAVILVFLQLMKRMDRTGRQDED